MTDLNWKHILLFYGISLLLSTLTYWTFRDVNQNTTEMLIANIVAILSFPIVVAVMIYTYSGTKKLKFTQKLIILFGLIFIDFVWTFLINYMNFFDREIGQSDIIIGLKQSLIYYSLMFIICLPIIGLVKTRIKNVC
jgi:uncharacterized membrane protein